MTLQSPWFWFSETDFKLPGLHDFKNSFFLLETPSLWKFVTIATGNYQRHLECSL